jgi:hypothetical protein
LLVALPAFAQPQAPSAVPPAHVSFVEGDATLYHDGDSEPAVVNMPVLDGDRIRTTTGRVEVTFGNGSAIAIDPDSDVEFVTGTRVRVLAGTTEYRAAVVDSSASSQYLPPDLQPYGSDFDRYGSWQNETGYGNVWYPTVAGDWRPYYYGYWAPMRSYGWSWIGYDPWTWPTHHYGRWGYAHNRWFWIPGRTWAAAWVSWGTAPDYVSWCPLGYNGQPVVAFSLGYHSSWNAWTFMPRDHFGFRGYPAHRYAVEPQRIAATTPFLIHRSAPVLDNRRTWAGAAAARDSAIAVPRNSVSPNTIRSADRGTYRVPSRESRLPQAPATATPSIRSAPAGGLPRVEPRVISPGGTASPAYRAPGGSRTGEYRVPRSGREGSIESGRPAPSDRRPAVADPVRPSIAQPATTNDQRRMTNDRSTTNNQRPTTNDQRPTTNDHPAYAAPRAEPRPAPPVRQSAPARQAAPPPQRQSAPAPSGGAKSGSQRDGGRSQGRSEGSAVHRPR